MTEENQKQQVLELLATGKITAGEAFELLQASGVDAKNDAARDVEAIKPQMREVEDVKKSLETSHTQASWLRIKVTDLGSGNDKVTVNVPMPLVRFGFNIGRRFVPELESNDMELLTHMLEQEQGMLVDVRDEEDGEQVQIYLE